MPVIAHPRQRRIVCCRKAGVSMLFCERLPASVLNSVPREQRRRECTKILADFATSFPSVKYRPLLDINLINAQAVTTLAARYVNLYGGLVFHPGIGEQSLLIVLLHETGHHLSPGRRSSINQTLACECEADHWAITEGADLLARQSGRVLQLAVAVQELSCIHSLAQRASQCLAPLRCWSGDWSARKQALLRQIPARGDCCD